MLLKERTSDMYRLSAYYIARCANGRFHYCSLEATLSFCKAGVRFVPFYLAASMCIGIFQCVLLNHDTVADPMCPAEP